MQTKTRQKMKSSIPFQSVSRKYSSTKTEDSTIRHMRTARSCPRVLDGTRDYHPVEVLHATTVPTLTHPGLSQPLHF